MPRRPEGRAVRAVEPRPFPEVAHASAVVHVAGVEQWLRDALGSGTDDAVG